MLVTQTGKEPSLLQVTPESMLATRLAHLLETDYQSIAQQVLATEETSPGGEVQVSAVYVHKPCLPPLQALARRALQP